MVASIMVDKSIVTIIDKSDSIIGDFELPIKITVKHLSQKIVALLKAMDNEKYYALDKIKIQYNNNVLNEDDTLYENAVWDGSIIKILF